jgi:transcriptional regulator with XRE-family HTH domain
MLSVFGKLLRKIRIDNGEILKDMADKLKVTSSYLSAVEVGKRAVPESWPEVIAKVYNLDDSQLDALRSAADEQKVQVKFDLNLLGQNDKNLVLSFAREFKELNDEEKDQIFSILKKRSV